MNSRLNRHSRTRSRTGIRTGRAAHVSGPTLTPHQAVAAWVAANVANVLAYYPMSDAAPSGVMADASGNGRNGTYGSAVAAATLDGETVADLNGTINAFAVVADAAWLDLIAGIFVVVEPDSFTDNPMIVGRDTTTDRHWQFRFATTGQVQFLQVTTGNPTRTGPTLTIANRYTIGVGSYGGSMQFVVDGATVVEAGGAPIFETGISGMYVGKNEFTTPDNQFFNGRIGSVVFLSTASDAAFQALHAAWT